MTHSLVTKESEEKKNTHDTFQSTKAVERSSHRVL